MAADGDEKDPLAAQTNPAVLAGPSTP
eukprot:SAG11_NODE_37066_length_258_cov_1.295597_1_plen_26_part_10